MLVGLSSDDVDRLRAVSPLYASSLYARVLERRGRFLERLKSRGGASVVAADAAQPKEIPMTKLKSKRQAPSRSTGKSMLGTAISRSAVTAPSHLTLCRPHHQYVRI
jgi:hypothetical protein